MNTLEFLTSLRKADITIKVTQEGLQINAPSGVITESIKEELKIRKKEILEVLQETGKSIKTDDQEITQIAREQEILLSPSQQRVWALTQFMPKNPSFNMHIAFYIEGPLDPLLLENCVQEIIRRHEVLRTTFSIVKGKPVQIISPEVPFTLTRVDLRKFNDQPSRSNIEQLANMEAREPFDLRHGPLVRGKLLEINNHLHVFMITMHHIISDGWSFFVFFTELTTLYENSRTGKKTLLPHLPIQYADFSNWHREWLETEQCQIQVEFWRRELKNIAPLVLPLDCPRPAQQTTEAALQTRALSSSIVREIRTSATYHGISINILFLTAFLVTLFKYSNQEDLVVCSPTLGRDRDELKSLIGFFNNIVPIRITLNNNQPISELLEKVRIKTLDALEHQDIPFHHLLAASDVGRVPLTRAIFDFQNDRTQSLRLPETTINILDIHNGTTNFELSFTIVEKGENYKCEIEYKTVLFDDKTIQGILTYFETVLRNMARTPYQKVSAIPSPINKQQQEKYLRLEGKSLTSDKGYAPPRDEIEQIIADIWQEVLEIEKIGIHDNFFDLGGHSLLATKLLTRLQFTLNREVSFQILFEAPTVAALAQHLGNVESIGWHQDSDKLISVSREASLPLSFAQQRLWFLDQLEPNSTAYLMSSTFHIRGPLMLKALEASFSALVAHHESLRTTFPLINEEPVQHIAPAWPLILPIIDLRMCQDQEREEEVARIVHETTKKPFDLANGPLFRFQVVAIGADEHLLVVTLHHIISDGWSMNLFYQELKTSYTAFSSGQDPFLPDLPIQYADYAVWQRAFLQGNRLAEQVAYWRKQLHEPLPVLTIPTDFPRPAIQEYRGAYVTLQLPPAITNGLKATSRKAGTTLFMTMLAALQVILQRWSGQDEVCIGIPSSGRTYQEIEKVMGFFINTLVVRTDLSANLTFLELLAQVREKCLEAYAHQDVPFEKLIEELQPKRQLNRNPIFDVFFNFIGTMDTTFELPDMVIKQLPHGEPESKFALTMYVEEQKNGINCTLVYQQALFREERAHSLMRQYQRVLEQLIAGPDELIESYSLVTTESQSWLPDPQTVLESPSQDSVLMSIHKWVEHTPDQIAVHHGSETLLYSEIFSRSEICARTFLKQGIGHEDVVAIRGPRSIGIIVATIGVWLARGVVMFLDPNLPFIRQKMMQKTSNAKILLEIGLENKSEAESEAELMPCLFIDPHTGNILSADCREEKTPSSFPSLQRKGPAYVFFTSGTMGTPKGVLGSHQALAHFLAWERDTLAIGPDDRVAQFTGLSFDVVLRDLFLPLTSGATLCLPPEGTEGHEQLAWAAAEQISVMHLVPSIAKFWLAETVKPITLPALRWVLFAGEPLTDQLLKRWETACPGQAQFVNLYGPTETTLAKCWHLIPPTKEEGVQSIGRPLPQTQLLVMGNNHRLCDIGEVGELVIRTPFCSLGYLNKEKETPSRFVLNPFQNNSTDWLYHTGDLGRYKLDGMVEILGRRDDQVKIRGVRVEPHEITTVLNTCPDVQTCSVLPGQDALGELVLTAYIVALSSRQLTMSSIRDYLSKRLPAALIPSQVVFLKQLPLTSNGKVDRQTLRSLKPLDTPKEEFVAPRTPMEEELVRIWTELLNLPAVDVRDNFFDLGGHSLLATRLLNRLRAFKINLSLRLFFDHPTLEKQALAIEEHLLQTFEDLPEKAEDNLNTL